MLKYFVDRVQKAHETIPENLFGVCIDSNEKDEREPHSERHDGPRLSIPGGIVN
jgi:hypothetical protein